MSDREQQTSLSIDHAKRPLKSRPAKVDFHSAFRTLLSATVLMGMSVTGTVSFAQPVDLGPSPQATVSPLGAVGISANAGPSLCNAVGGSSSFELSPGKNGLFFRTSTDLEEMLMITHETQANLKKLSDTLAVRGTKLVLMPLPTRGIVQYAYLSDADLQQRNYDREFAKDEFQAFIGQLREAGIATVDVLAGIERQKMWDNFFYLRDHHWTTNGAHEAAKLVAETIRDLPAYVGLPKIKFETKNMGEVLHKVDMALEIQRQCRRTVPGEADQRYVTTRAVASADDLFGSSSTSSASALVGSSFSATPEFNFDGFLSQETGLEFANYAVNGAEFTGSLATLVSSDAFLKNPPPILVWESPSYYNIDQEVFRSFRQIIPALYGPCAPNNIVAKSASFAIDGQSKAIDLSAGPDVTGGNYYVTVEASQVGLRGIGIRVGYDDGDEDTVTLGDFARFKDDGKFYHQLSGEFEGRVTDITMTGNTGASQVVVTMCKVPTEFANL